MRKITALVVAISVMSGALVLPGFAQNTVTVPGVQAPVPLPPPPTTNPPQPGAQPKLDTFGDKVIRCQHYGAVQGLPAGSRDAYTRGCANN